MSLVHKFKQGENYFVLDVNTGSVHIVDELVYDLIDDDSLRPKEALIAEFGDKYKADIISEAYDEIKTRVSKGKKEVIREHATRNGESLNGFINRAIDETMERDKAQW